MDEFSSVFMIVTVLLPAKHGRFGDKKGSVTVIRLFALKFRAP